MSHLIPDRYRPARVAWHAAQARRLVASARVVRPAPLSELLGLLRERAAIAEVARAAERAGRDPVRQARQVPWSGPSWPRLMQPPASTSTIYVYADSTAASW